MIEVKFTCANVREFKDLLNMLSKDNEEAASVYEETHEEAKAVPPAAEPEAIVTMEAPKALVTIEKQYATPTVSLQDLQTLGRQLAAAGKGPAIQTILKAHGYKLLSKIPEAERAAVYAEMQGVE